MSLLKSIFSSKTNKSRKDQQPKDKNTQDKNSQDPSTATTGGVAQAAQTGFSLQRSIGNLAMNRRAGGGQKDSSSGNDSAKRLDAIQELLDKERDNQAPVIAEAEYNRMVKDAVRKTTEFALLDKSTAAVREALKQKAAEKVAGNIDKTDYSPQEKEDAKKYAIEHVERQVIIPQALYRYSDQLVKKSANPRYHQKEILVAARMGFREVKPDPAIPPEKQVEDAAVRAKRKARAEADRLSDLLLRQNQEQLLADAKGDLSAIVQHMEIGESLGVSEVKKRHELDDMLVDDTTVSNVYSHDLFEPMKKAVANKLSVGRGFFQRQSKESKEFRKKMKEAGRAQAREDIARQVDRNNNFTHETEKEFHKMIASVHAYKLAKGSVDKALENEAGKIVEGVIPLGPTKEQLKAAAKSSAYSIARSNPKDQERIKNKALQGARAKAVEILKKEQAKAINEARKIYKGDKYKPNSRPDVTKQNDVAKSVKQQVTKDDVAGAAIKMAVESPSLNSAFTRISKILDMAVPNEGDSASFDFEIKIPVHESGAYIMFAFGGEVEKDADEFTVGAQIAFGAGWTNFGFDANFRLGVFLEAKSKNSVGALNLISYGFYREVRRLSDAAADTLWGYGGKSGKSKREEAELWAAMVEHKFMGDEGYVDIGLLAQAQGGVNAGVVKGEANVGARIMNRFDKEAIERLSPGSFGKADPNKAGKIGGGSTRFVIEGGAEAEADIAGLKVGISAEGSLALVNWRPRELEFSAQGSIPFAFGEETATWAKNLAKFATPVMGAIKNIVSTMKKKISTDPNIKTNMKTSSASGGLDTLATLQLLNTKFDNIGNNLVSKLQGEEEINNTVQSWFTKENYAESVTKEMVNKIALSNTFDVQISLGFEWDQDGKFDKWEIALEVGQTKSFEIEVELVNISVEKSSRLGKLAYGTEGLEFNLLGIGNK